MHRAALPPRQTSLRRLRRLTCLCRRLTAPAKTGNQAAKPPRLSHQPGEGLEHRDDDRYHGQRQADHENAESHLPLLLGAGDVAGAGALGGTAA
jgi:hypothetical protein